MLQPPIRNPSVVAAFIYSHSGEFGAVARDLRLPGRGLDVELIRSYRSSLADVIGELGRGWSCSLAQRVERDGDGVLFHDGTGSVHRFARRKTAYAAPPGLYAVLREVEQDVVLEQRFGVRTLFELPEQGGRILRVEDRNGNALSFSYEADSVRIVDALNRPVTVSVEDGLWREVTDHTGRSWRFVYDANSLLVEVVRPATRDFPDGTSMSYGYDEEHRLVELTNARVQTYLVNRYDEAGRIVGQTHGAGEYALEYEDGHRTRCRLKNGGLVELVHDNAGRVTRSTLHVRRDAFSPDDLTGPGKLIPLVTESAYNGAGELVRRRLPSGRETRWAYGDDDLDARNRGNLLKIVQVPQPDADSDYEDIVTTWEYAKDFQVPIASVDPRGHRTTFEYDERGNLVATTYPAVTIQPVGEERAKANSVERVQQVRLEYDAHGQLVRRTEIDGTVTEYSYHPHDAAKGPARLARVVRDPGGVRLMSEYGYDAFGNCSEVVDGKGNVTRLAYNALGLVESSISRAPFEDCVDYIYDADGNEIEAIQSFERVEIDRANGKTNPLPSTLRMQRTYDELGNVTERRIVGGEKVIRESFVRDAGDRLVRQIQPLGNVTEYAFDERDLVIEKRFALGSPEGFAERFTYTLDGSPRTRTDGDGNTTVHRYDGFGRYQGFADPAGTTKHQALDEAGNVVAVTVAEAEQILMEAGYRVDEWNRVFRIDRAWHDMETGAPEGKSEWDGAEGAVSTVVEYAEDGRPGRVWYESGNVVTYVHDGCGRLAAVTDSTGQELSLTYDDNSNVTDVTVSRAGGRGRTVVRCSYDAMDRLELQQVGETTPERFRYNALGAIAEYVGSNGLFVHHIHDVLGRHTGHVYEVADSTPQSVAQRPVARVAAPDREGLPRRVVAEPMSPGRARTIVRTYEYDDNYRLAAYVDAAGNRTIYKYDELDRQVSVVHPDGSVARVVYDARGNPLHVVDANGRQTVNRYDAAGRLVEIVDPSGLRERYDYDGAGRLLAALGRDTLRRTYDSMSLLKTEMQRAGTVRFAHDSAGNLTTLVYPSGYEVHRSYDIRHRVTSVRGGDGTPVASFAYGDGDHVSRIRFGDVLVAALEYDAQERLESIEYRTIGDDAVIDGYRYAYDSADKMKHEIQLGSGDMFGERYFFDEERRPVRAQYGVEDVFDPESPFEQQATYEYFPEGRWSRRIDVDGSGQVLSESLGELDVLNRYRHFGKYSFSYDGNGNCVRKESANPGFCLYTYDGANRLIKVECYDANAHLVRTIEYFYDALGRQTRKVVTDAAGVSTEFTYVWIGSLLAEEYENGVLMRTYVYGIGANPVQLSSQKAGADFTYLLNGRGLVSGIVRKDDPNAFAEKYGYEVTGSVFMTEVDGVPVDLPERPTTISGLDNPLVTGDVFGSVLVDWANGTFGSSGGGHMDTMISDALNALGEVGAKGHHGVKSQMADQLKGILGMLGLGGNTSAPPPSGGSGPDITMNPDWKLYADGDTDSDLTPPPLVSVNDDGSDTVHNADGSSSTGGGPGEWKQWPGDKPDDSPTNSGSNSGSNLTPSNVPSSGTIPATSGLGGGTPAAEPNDPSKNLGNDKINGFINDHPVISAIAGLGIQAVRLSTGGPPKMTDPDYGGGTPTPPSPDELDAKLNRLKHPVNPTGGPMEDPVDTSSPPPNKGGLDPTQILVDPDATGGDGSGGINKLDIAPIDHVPDWQPDPVTTPMSGGSSGGDTTTVGKQWP